MCTYYNYSIPMSPEMKKADIVIEDEDVGSFEIPQVHFNGFYETDDKEFIFEWGVDSLFVKRGDHIVKYSERSGYDVLLKDVHGDVTWQEGIVAKIIGNSVDDVIDFRSAKEYTIEEYDLEKSVKKRYIVVLKDASGIDEYERCALEKHFND